MRGQASLEMLIVVAVFLAVLGLWLGGVATAKATIESAFDLQQTRATALAISKAINTVCVMGPGNSLLLETYLPLNTTIEYDGNFTFCYGNNTIEHPSHCDFNTLKLDSGKQTLSIENNGGTIRLQGV